LEAGAQSSQHRFQAPTEARQEPAQAGRDKHMQKVGNSAGRYRGRSEQHRHPSASFLQAQFPDTEERKRRTQPRQHARPTARPSESECPWQEEADAAAEQSRAEHRERIHT